MIHKRYPFVIVILCCLASSALAQPNSHQIDAWIKSLSVKKDPRATRLQGVLKEFLATDTSTWCQTIERIKTKSKQSNIRCQIRTNLLHHLLGQNGIKCSIKDDVLHESLQSAYEIEDDLLQYEIHYRLGGIYNQLQQYGLAAMHYHVFFDILTHNNREDFYLPAKVLYDMSYGLYYTHDYAGCIEKGLNAQFALPQSQYVPDDTLNIYYRMQGWNTIGLAYHKLKQYEAAFNAFDKAEDVAREGNNIAWIGIISGNKGDVYYDLGKYDSAYVLLQFDFDRSFEAHEYNNAANSLQWIARIDLHKGRAKLALQKLQLAREILLKQPQPNYLANIYFAFSQVHATFGNADSVNTYLKKYLHLHDSLQGEITQSRTDILQMRMNNLDQTKTIKILNRQKSQIALTRNFTIILVVLLGGIIYLWLNRLRIKAQLRQREALEGKQLAESEAQRSKEQLDIFRQHLLEKNELIEKWQTANEEKEISEDQLRRLSELTHHLILKEDDWVQFKALFDSVYPGFFISLRNKVPDITQAEQRMAALSKLKLTAKEAANLLGVSPNTVYTTRRRLRQRLGLENDSDLDPYFNEG